MTVARLTVCATVKLFRSSLGKGRSEAYKCDEIGLSNPLNIVTKETKATVVNSNYFKEKSWRMTRTRVKVAVFQAATVCCWRRWNRKHSGWGTHPSPGGGAGAAPGGRERDCYQQRDWILYLCPSSSWGRWALRRHWLCRWRRYRSTGASLCWAWLDLQLRPGILEISAIPVEVCPACRNKRKSLKVH